MPENESSEFQLIYKIGALEAVVSDSMKRLDDFMFSIKQDMASNREEIVGDLKKIETNMEKIDTRVSNLETFKNNIVARVSGIATVAIIAWAILGHTVEALLDRIIN